MVETPTVETTDSDDEKKTKSKARAEKIIEEARDRFKACSDREEENWQRAKDAIKFRALEQWPDEVKRDRENPVQEGGPQPCPVLDKTNQYIRQIVNEERLNRPAIKARPVDDAADVKVADVYNGLIRHIEDSSNAVDAYTTAGEHAIDGGFGYWRIITEYCDPMSFDQDIRIKRIPNRFMALLGPHTEMDGSDAKYGFVFEDIDKDDFKVEYPDALPTDFDAAVRDYPGWYTTNTVRVCEYYRVEPRQTKIVLLADSQVMEKDEYEKTVSAGGKLPAVMKERTTIIPKVRWYKLTATDLLAETDVVGKFVPIIKVLGNELVMEDGKSRTSGATETMMDPQRLHNYAHAGFITHVALAPRAPWVAAETQVEDWIDDWKDANRKNIAVLRYKPALDESGQPVPPPQRTPPPGVASGWQQVLMNTEHGVEGAVGMYGASIGGPSRERSGVALGEQKQQGSVGNFHYPDNLSRSIRHTGRILLEWIPKYYDTRRIARILGEDGTPGMAHLNPEQSTAVAPRMDAAGNQVGESYNLNVGKYDVTITVGPSWSTKRQEGAEMISEAMRTNPELAPLIGDLYFKGLDVPYADEISKRLKAMLPAQIQQLEADKDKKPLDPRVAGLMKEIEQRAAELEQRGQALMQAEQEIQQEAQKVGADKSAVQSERAKLDADRRVFIADAGRIKAEIKLMGKEMLDQMMAGCMPMPNGDPNAPTNAGVPA